MACKENEEKCFTFLWKLENISYCLQKKGERIESPSFVVDAIEGTKWKLRLLPRGVSNGNYIGYFLVREKDTSGGDKVEIRFELAFIAKDGSVLASHGILKHTFPKDAGGFVYGKYQKREDVFTSKRSAEDSLTARCKIWKSVGEMTEDVLCTAHTRIGVEKRSFLWNVKNFSALEPEKKCTYEIKSIKDDAPLMAIDLSVTGGLSSEEIIRFELSLLDENIKFSTLKLCLIAASGNRVECNQDEFWFGSLDKSKQFTFFFTKEKLLANKSVYLPDDILSLHWEWAFSKGVILEEIEEVRFGARDSENKTPDNRNVDNEKKVPLSCTLSDNLKSVYERQVLCDVKLKTNTGVFPAHKIILSAASSVFNAMFTNDMKEKNSDSVNIQDLSDDAVSRMLLYMYTARVENLSWESASHLYVAADKYGILSLKNICSSYLKDNLTPRNACEVLLLSDCHADGDFKSAVQDYILKRIKEIAKSDEWKLLMETNAKLAAETVCLQYN